MRPGLEMRGFILGLALLPLVAPAQGTTPCLEGLHGSWRGPGRVAGRDILMQQDWRPALGGAFSELIMTHHLPADSTRVVFEGRGFYRATGDTIGGTWMDARGLTMTLRGSCRDLTLAMEWSGAERGATHYTRHANGTLEVADLVDTPGGRREFGRSRLQRVTPAVEVVGRGVISTEAPEFATTVTADGRELFFNRASADRSELTLMVSTKDPSGQYTAPRTLPFSGTARDIDPFLSPDGRRLYFSSDRPRAGRPVASFSTWYVERTASGWSAPVDPGAPLNSDSADVFVSMSGDGEFVFSSTRDGVRRIYTTRESNGHWVVPRLLPMVDSVGASNPMISPSGRYLVYVKDMPGRAADLLVACRSERGFGAGVPLSINSPYAEFAPAFSPDESTLYFTSERPGIVGPAPAGVRPPGDLYSVPWNAVAPTC